MIDLVPLERKVAKWLMAKVLWLTTAISEYLLKTPLELLQSETFNSIYNLVSTIATAFITVVVIWNGYKLMSNRVSFDEIKDSFIRMLLMPFIVKLMPVVLKFLVKFCNDVSEFLVDGIDTIEIAKNYAPAALEAGLIIFLVIYAGLLVKLLLYYAYRNYALLFHVAFFPILYILWCFPSYQDKSRIWVDEIKTLLSTQIAHALQLLLLVQLTIGINGQVKNLSLSLLLTQIGGLLFMQKTHNWLSQYMVSESKVRNSIPNKNDYYKYKYKVMSGKNNLKNLFYKLKGGK